MGTLRKYLLNGAIISSVFSGLSAFRQQRSAPKDWRTYVTWIAWGMSLAVAIGTVRINSQEDVDGAPKVRSKAAKGPKPAKDPR